MENLEINDPNLLNDNDPDLERFGIDPDEELEDVDLDYEDDEDEKNWIDEHQSFKASEEMLQLEQETIDAWWDRAQEWLNQECSKPLPVTINDHLRDKVFNELWGKLPIAPDLAPELRDEYTGEELKAAAEIGFSEGWYEWVAEHTVPS